MAEKVTRVLHSQGLNRDKYDRLARIAVLCGKVRADAWQRYSGVSTASQSPAMPGWRRAVTGTGCRRGWARPSPATSRRTRVTQSRPKP